ncbi:MAG: hypothetical protein ABWW69_06035 [Pyrodictiaceae archaeon]
MFMVERILWSIYGPCEEVMKMLKLRASVDPRSIDPGIIDKYFDEDSLMKLTSMLVRA